MSRLAQTLGHVMMGISPSKSEDAALKAWAETEYRRDSKYAYEMLSVGKLPDFR